ncbi:MAG: BON domain-containing protein [Williamsia sp.]|nr:BON domain-containing protein [Williamsia sp.]
MQNKLTNWVWMAGLFLLLAACQPSNDANIARAVQTSVRILDSTLQITVSEGVVTLNGTVKDSLTRNTVETSVKEINGVKSVINKLSVQ